MIKSMTGFAKAEVTLNETKIIAEGRTLNNRYLEIGLKLPKGDILIEQKLRELIKGRIRRGKVDISFKIERAPDQSSGPRINEPVLQRYLEIEHYLKEEHHIKGHLEIDAVLALKDIFAYDETVALSEDAFIEVCKDLLSRLHDERLREGSLITDEFSKRLAIVSALVEEIENQWPVTVKGHEAKLRERLEEVAGAANIEEGRVLQEMAIYMERLDITEEIVRLKGHVGHFADTILTDEAVGRKLDFIVQEMVRETNTIGSKANDLFIGERVIQIKVEIEKMREQVQNVE